MKSIIFITVFLFLFSSCSTPFPNQKIQGKTFPTVQGEALSGDRYTIPSDLKEEKTLLLIGYVQNSQFDIDRWLIGLDMTKTRVQVFEVPTIKGLVPKLIKGKINNGMRNGIPKQIWKAVITIYEDGERVQKFTGNEKPNNARVLLIDKNGKVLFFYDEGFSVPALNQLRKTILN